jgi:hypothetical protein
VQNESGADPHVHSGLNRVAGADPHVTPVHSELGFDSRVQSGEASQGQVRACTRMDRNEVESISHVLITIDDIANSRRKENCVDSNSSKASTRSSRVNGQMGTGGQEGQPGEAGDHDVGS